MNEYIVKEGDNLTKIANLYGTTVLDILRINNIPNPNFISIGNTIKIPKVDRYIPLIKNFNEIKLLEKDINSLSNIDIINYYHKNKKDNLIYLIDDKLNDKLSVYKNGVLLKSYRAIHGKNRDLDDMTITHLDSRGKLVNLAGNLSTPAGIFFTTRGNMYHGAPSFIRRTKEQVASNNPNGIPSSIHARNIVEGANTNGCTGMSVEDLKDLSKYITKPNVRTYILPANKLNKFFIRNSELQFKSHDILRTPSYNTLVNKPIKYITYNTNNLTDTNKNIIKLFSQGLIEAKKSLLKDLGINNDTYNELALNALGILGVESGYGNENTAIGNLLRAARKSIFSNNSSPDYKSKYFTYGINRDNNSVGLTQIRFSFLSDREKELFKKYNITKESLVTDPKKAAIATMIKLGQSYLDRGNIDKAVSAWNNKPSYLLLVAKNKLRFNLFEMYRLGGILKNLNGGNILSLEDKNRLWDFHERFGADRSKEHYFNFWNFLKGNLEVSNYFNSYLNSPGFNRIINNQNRWWESRHPYRKFYSNPDKGTQAWFKAAREVNPYLYTADMYSDLSTTLYNTNVGGQRSVFIGRRASEFPYLFVIGHEYLHGKAPFNSVGNNPLFNPQSALAEALKLNTNTESGHDSLLDEKHADIWGLKYLFYKEGIYDSRSNKDININQVKLLRLKYPNLRPFLLMNDSQIMFQMNNVATNMRDKNYHA